MNRWEFKVKETPEHYIAEIGFAWPALVIGIIWLIWLMKEIRYARRKNQLKNEEAMAQTLVDEGYEVFSPTVVCDRIAVKDGSVYFVEFKKSGQELRPGQQRIHDLAPEMYLVRYS